MSLLMDALKKAEKAKQGPNSVFGDPAPAAPATDWPVLSIDAKPPDLEAELGLAPPAPRRSRDAAESPPPKPQPSAPISLEPIASSPIAPEAPRPGAPERATPPSAKPQQPSPAGNAQDRSDAMAAERVAAKGVFTAKQGSRTAGSSRTPFYAVLALLLLGAAGASYYFWSEFNSAGGTAPAAKSAGQIGAGRPTSGGPDIRQAPAAVASATTIAPAAPVASPPTAAAADAGPQAARPPEPAAAPAARPVSPVAQSAPAPAAPARPAQAQAPTSEASRARAAGVEAPARNAAVARGGTPVEAPRSMRITRDRDAPGVDPATSAGYAALLEGNLESARDHYNRALSADRNSRDALLGLAAVASRSGRRDTAESLYERVLELHPRDSFAIAQLSALRSGGDAAVSESRVKSMLAQEHEPARAAPLHFALGNQMAAQARWAEAQQAYFNAHAAEPDNPDYCYNLAVSLDQLHQPRLAHEHYARAIDLAGKRRAGFDVARARARLEALANAAK